MKGCFVCVLFFGMMVSMVQATVIPDDLFPGDEYHLVFVTQDGMMSGSRNINDYNDFVQGQDRMLECPSSIWMMRMSTPRWSMCVAKLWRSECGRNSLSKPHSLRAFSKAACALLYGR